MELNGNKYLKGLKEVNAQIFKRKYDRSLS